MFMEMSSQRSYMCLGWLLEKYSHPRNDKSYQLSTQKQHPSLENWTWKGYQESDSPLGRDTFNVVKKENPIDASSRLERHIEFYEEFFYFVILEV